MGAEGEKGKQSVRQAPVAILVKDSEFVERLLRMALARYRMDEFASIPFARFPFTQHLP